LLLDALQCRWNQKERGTTLDESDRSDGCAWDAAEELVRVVDSANANRLLDAASPSRPTPIPDIVTALRAVDGLHGLVDEEYQWLASHCSERVATGPAIGFRENEPAHHLNIILTDEVYVHRRNSASVSMFIGRTGQITGKLPYSRMTTWGGEGWLFMLVVGFRL
jgi:hypothetical protein